MSMARFKASEEEILLVSRILAYANCQETHTIPVKTAVDILERSGLPTKILHEVWDIADSESQGSLSEKELAVAIRLLGWAQIGESVSGTLLDKPGPLPIIKGLSDVPLNESASSSFTSTQEIAYQGRFFHRIYQDANPVDDLLDGDKVRDIFLKSNLSYDNLASIWNLVDTRERGCLNATEFAVGMYLIQALKSCQISEIPSYIPPILFQHMDYHSISNSRHTPATTPRLTNKRSMKDNLLSTKSISKESDWGVSLDEQKEASLHFEHLDPQNQGFVDGDVAAKFMLRYKLPPTDIAHIWDLVDLNNDNRLTREELGLAIHLIRNRLAGGDIPDSLPPSLLPPSCRSVAASSPLILASPLRASNPINNGMDDLSPRTPLPEYSLPHPRPSLSPLPSYSRRRTVSQVTQHHNGPDNPVDFNDRDSPAENWLWVEELRTETKNLQAQVQDLSMQLRAQSNYRETTGVVSKENKAFKSQLRKSGLSPFDQPSSEERPDGIHTSSEETRKEIHRLFSRVIELEHVETELEETKTVLGKLKDYNKDLQKQLEDAETKEMTSAAGLDSLESRVKSLEENNEELSHENRHLQVEVEESSRHVAQIAQENENLKTQITDIQTTEVAAFEELKQLERKAQDLEQNQISLTRENKELKEENRDLGTRLRDLEKSLAEPDTASSRKQLRVLLKDTTQENDKLKGRIREMQQSMAQYLLSNQDPSRHENLVSENRRLTMQIQEMEMVATQIQSSSEDSEMRRVMADLTMENEELKSRMRASQQTVTRMRSSHSTELDDLRRQVNDLTQQIRSYRPRDPSFTMNSQPHEPIAPPSYDSISPT